MKVAIIVLSPSGNTLKVARMMKRALLNKNVQGRLIDVTRNKDFFGDQSIETFLSRTIEPHDVLLSPVQP